MPRFRNRISPSLERELRIEEETEEVQDAVEEGKFEEDDIEEHSDGSKSGKAPKTSRRHSIRKGGKK